MVEHTNLDLMHTIQGILQYHIIPLLKGDRLKKHVSPIIVSTKAAPTGPLNTNVVKQMNKSELEVECRSRGLSCIGTKDVLFNRLKLYLKNNTASAAAS